MISRRMHERQIMYLFNHSSMKLNFIHMHINGNMRGHFFQVKFQIYLQSSK